MAKKKRSVGRPRTPAAKALGRVVTVRFDKSVAARLDKYCAAQETAATRSQVVRALTESALSVKGF